MLQNVVESVWPFIFKQLEEPFIVILGSVLQTT